MSNINFTLLLLHLAFFIYFNDDTSIYTLSAEQTSHHLCCFIKKTKRLSCSNVHAELSDMPHVHA